MSYDRAHAHTHTHTHHQPDTRGTFKIAIICALRTKSDASEAIFDQFSEEEVDYTEARGPKTLTPWVELAATTWS